MNDEQVFVGLVECWDDINGLGEISVDRDGRKVWVHYAVIEPSGGGDEYRTLRPGRSVELKIEQADQDGYSWRATWVRSVAQ